jgi:anti-sigma B factor antagonist
MDETHTFDIQKRKKGDVILLDVSGNLTLGEGEQTFKDTVIDLLNRKQNKILVNLKDLQFMDSSGVGALVKSYTTVTQSGGRLKLLQPAKMVLQTLKITGLLGIFETFDDEAKAIASY